MEKFNLIALAYGSLKAWAFCRSFKSFSQFSEEVIRHLLDSVEADQHVLLQG